MTKKSSRKKSGRQKSRQKIDRPHKTAKKEPPDKISQTQQKKPRQKKKIVEKPAQEIKWHFDRKKLIATIPFAIALILFLWVWTEPGPRVLDPWFAAAMLVDSSKKVSDPALKKQLLEQGGDELRELEKKYSFHARVHFLLGYYYINAQKWDSAISQFNITIKMDSGAIINPVAPDARKNLIVAVINQSKIYLKNGNTEKAFHVLEQATAYKYSSVELITHYGVIYHKQGRLDSAIKYYTQALRLNKNHAPAKNNISFAYFFKGNIALNNQQADKALEFYNKALTYSQKNPDLFTNVGKIYLKKNQTSQAIENFKKALSINPSHPGALQNLTNIYSSSGDMKTARMYRQKLLQAKK